VSCGVVAQRGCSATLISDPVLRWDLERFCDGIWDPVLRWDLERFCDGIWDPVLRWDLERSCDGIWDPVLRRDLRDEATTQDRDRNAWNHP
jgi:hypothetical protein